MNRKHSAKWGLGAAALVGTQFYAGRELAAALLLFTLLFIALAGVVLFVFLLQETGRSATSWWVAHAPACSRVSQRWLAPLAQIRTRLSPHAAARPITTEPWPGER